MSPAKPAKKFDASKAGRYSYQGLERVIHEKARIGIMTSLAMRPEGLLFSDLKELCSLTDGNLNRHLKVLREARLVDVKKGVRDNRSQTLCRITPKGRARLMDYINELERVLADAEQAAKADQAADRGTLKGWSPA